MDGQTDTHFDISNYRLALLLEIRLKCNKKGLKVEDAIWTLGTVGLEKKFEIEGNKEN